MDAHLKHGVEVRGLSWREIWKIALSLKETIEEVKRGRRDKFEIQNLEAL